MQKYDNNLIINEIKLFFNKSTLNYTFNLFQFNDFTNLRRKNI